MCCATPAATLACAALTVSASGVQATPSFLTVPPEAACTAATSSSAIDLNGPSSRWQLKHMTLFLYGRALKSYVTPDSPCSPARPDRPVECALWQLVHVSCSSGLCVCTAKL